MESAAHRFRRSFPLMLVVSALPATLPAITRADVKINEIKIKGLEYVELYNTGYVSEDVTGWTLSSQVGAKTIVLSGFIPGLGFRTWTNGEAPPDSLPISFMDNSGDVVTLRDATATLVDDVGYGTKGGAPIGFNSVGRYPDGDDTDDWARDFDYRDDSYDSFAETPDATNRNTEPALGSGLVLNELDPQGTGVGGLDRVEVYNPTGGTIDLQDYFLSDGDGFCRVTNSIPIYPGGSVLLSEDAVGQGMDCTGNDDIEFSVSDVVYLFRPDGVRIDQLGYEGYPTLSPGESLQRCPDGAGAHDAYTYATQGGNTDLRRATATFGAANSCPPSILTVSRTPCVPTAGQSPVVQAVGLYAVSVSIQYAVDGGTAFTQNMNLISTNGDLTTWEGSIPGQADGAAVLYSVRMVNAYAETTASSPGGYFAGTTDIGALRVDDVQGRNVYEGYGARVHGNVTVPPGVFTSFNIDFYVQDATGGVNLFYTGAHPDIQALALTYGDVITAVGELDQYNGRLELGRGLDCDTLVVAYYGPGTIPAPLDVAACDVGESQEGMLIRVPGAFLPLQSSGDTLHANTSYQLSSCVPGLVMRVEDNVGIEGTVIPPVCDSLQADVIGIGHQFDSTLPYSGGWEVLPRIPGDLAFPTAALDRQDVIDLVTAQIIQGSPYESTLVGFLYDRDQPDSLLHAGDVITDADSTVFKVMTGDTYLVFLDLDSRAFWYHPAEYVFIDPCSGAWEADSSTSWPLLNGAPITRFMELGNASPDLFYGAYQEWLEIPEFPAPARPPADSVWAIIVAGEPKNDCDSIYIGNEVKRAKQHLNGSDNGPGLPLDCITVLGFNGSGKIIGASPQEIYDALAARMNCKKLYFTYVGHGKIGEMQTRSLPLTYKMLACKFLEAGIKKVCVRLVTCYSGSAVEPIVTTEKKIDGEKRRLKGTITFTSSAANTTELNPRGSPASGAFLVCLDDPLGDINTDGKREDVEAQIWAATLDSTASRGGAGGVIFGDGHSTSTAPPKWIELSPVNADGAGPLVFRRLKFTFEDRATKKKTCYQYLYAENMTGSPHPASAPGGPKGVPPVAQNPHPVTAYCTDTKPPVPVFTGTIILGPHERKCVGRVPGDCRTLWVPPIGHKSPTRFPLLGDAEDVADLHNWYVETVVYGAGDLVFVDLPLGGVPGDDFVMSVDSRPGWDLHMDSTFLTVPALIPDQVAILEGTVPDTATEGASLWTSLVNTTQADTAIVEVQVLLYDSLAAPVGGGATHRYRYLDSASGLLVNAGSASLQNSVLHFLAPTSCLVDTGGTLDLENTNVEADSGQAFTFEARGHLNWNNSALIEPSGGLHLVSPHADVLDGAVINSLGDGLTFAGSQSQTSFRYFHVVGAAGDGIRLDAATGALLDWVIVEDSGGQDVRAVNGSSAVLHDCFYDEGKETAESGSTLTRVWSTAFRFAASNGIPIYGVTVEVRDALGATVALDTTSVTGLTGFHDLTQYVRMGAVVTPHTPHQLFVHSDFGDTVLTYTADSLRVALFSIVDSTVTGIGLPPQLVLVQNVPNPMRSSTVIRYSLPAEERVSLRVFDVRGGLVTELQEGIQDAGPHEVVWKPEGVAPGLYFYRLDAPGTCATRKLLLLPP